MAQVAALPLCLLSPDMRNRRIMNGYFTDDGVTAAPAIESDTVSGLYSHRHAVQNPFSLAHCSTSPGRPASTPPSINCSTYT
ncbi:MAG TPA: hypothetical protein VFI00_05345 [Kribbella sp.]|nr:hypothetical protein [Kribbella sp.]